MATISGAHMILYSANGDADRAFLRDVLGFPHVDVGRGWLIFALPASEIAIHPAQASGEHEIYLMVDDVAAFVARMNDRGIRCTPARRGVAFGCRRIRSRVSVTGCRMAARGSPRRVPSRHAFLRMVQAALWV